MVRHQLVMLPYYSVFDNLTYRVEGDKVILEGQVVRPTLKSDAQAAVKSIEGVRTVVNNIEVLPPSPMMINCAARFTVPSTAKAVFHVMPSPRCLRSISS